MAPQLIIDGKIQILGQTANSVVYAVGSDDDTMLAKDSLSVLKGGSVWYKGQEALGPGKDIAESDECIRKEASIYQTLGQHDHILSFISLETSALDGPGSIPKAWALRLERSPLGSLRDNIVNTSTNPPSRSIRLCLAYQFSKGVAHLHQHEIVWGDLSTRNAFLFDEWRVKLGDFADSDGVGAYPRDWYGCEDRYCPPGSDNPQRHGIGTMNRELFALGSAIYEILEWKVPYGSNTEIEDIVREALSNGEWPELSDDNPAKSIIQKLWGYSYDSSREVVHDLQGLLPSCG
ncbi:Protein kinase domain-containing protein [Fusarium sp. LHS14.1]|nr:Protein kinase domain-containing protein [Fusarium sp. LHS14.1]